MSKLRKAINSVMADLSIEGISKARKNEQQGYRFRGIDDVLNFLSPVYAKHGLIVVPSFKAQPQIERKTAKGNPLYYAFVEAIFKLYHVEEPSEMIEAGPFIGEAMDSADKATNKAMSAAYKYFALLTFAIPVEGTPDADYGDPEPAAPTGKPVDVEGWIKTFAGCLTREELLGAWGQAKLAIADAPDQAQAEAAYALLIAARDARGKDIAKAAKPKKTEATDAGN
jgi:hypothetical protein